MKRPFLSIIGLSEKGLDELSPLAQTRLQQAKLIVGGKRHLTLAQSLINSEKMIWSSPISHTISQILSYKSESVAILASGDPFWYGVGPLLTQNLARDEWECFPAISCQTLAYSQLGWIGQNVQTVSLCGRPIETLRPALAPHAHILILSSDQQTPHQIIHHLKEWQILDYDLYLLEALGGKEEKIRQFTANDPLPNDIHPLNIVALQIRSGSFIPLTAGLEDEWFENDGQLTKQAIRTNTLAALRPYPGAILWDIGTGSGSIAIEWMLRHPTCRAFAIELLADRATRAIKNAKKLGVPALELIKGKAPEALQGLPTPDAIFIGGGSTHPDVIQNAWDALKPQGRFVINSVTVEGDLRLFSCYQQWGGKLTRLHIEHYKPIGSFHGFRPARSITQYAVTKS